MRMTRPFQRLLARALRRIALPRRLTLWLPWLVLAVALSVTVALWQHAKAQFGHILQSEFDYNVREAVRDIEKRMNTYNLLLQGLEGLFVSSDTVTRSEFRKYIQALDLKQRYSQVQAMGFIAHVRAEERSAHMAAIRKDGIPEYHIHPENTTGDAAPIVYIEPLDGHNRTLLGTDLQNLPRLQAVMQQARAKNTATLSQKFMAQHADDPEERPHFLMFSPIFLHPDQGAPPRFIGWAFALFHADNMFDVLSQDHKEKIDLSIYDGTQISEANLMATTRDTPEATAPKNRLKTVQTLSFGGHIWSIEAYARIPTHVVPGGKPPDFILYGGIATSLLLALLMQVLLHGREHALRLASDMNSALIQSEYRWKFALQGAGEGVWDWNMQTGSVFLSTRAKEMLGYPADTPQGTMDLVHAHIHPDDLPSLMQARMAHVEGKQGSFICEVRVRHADNSWRWCLIRGMVVSRDHANKPLRMIGTTIDITERHKQIEALRLSDTVLNTLNEAVLVTDSNNRIVSVNPAFTDITGYSAEDVLGKSPALLSDGVRRPELAEEMWQSLRNHGSWIGDIVNRHKSGELYVARISVSCVRDEKGETVNYVGAFSDISERKALEQRMQVLAHFDPLTDLPNRALFHDRLRQALAACRRNHTRLALLFIDLDKFKPVNDTLGHAVGDLLLKEMAYRLLDSIRESDTAARIGGDEFVVLLSNVDNEDSAMLVAGKILQAIETPVQLDEHALNISASIGVAVYPDHGSSDEEILTNADSAMYLAKHGGGRSIASASDLSTTNSTETAPEA